MKKGAEVATIDFFVFEMRVKLRAEDRDEPVQLVED